MLTFLMITFKGDDSQVLTKMFLGCKTDKRLGEDLHLKDKEFITTNFLSKYFKKMEISGLYQKETSLEFTQAESH